jgi:hypothetical protein
LRRAANAGLFLLAGWWPKARTRLQRVLRGLVCRTRPRPSPHAATATRAQRQRQAKLSGTAIVGWPTSSCSRSERAPRDPCVV